MLFTVIYVHTYCNDFVMLYSDNLYFKILCTFIMDKNYVSCQESLEWNGGMEHWNDLNITNA